MGSVHAGNPRNVSSSGGWPRLAGVPQAPCLSSGVGSTCLPAASGSACRPGTLQGGGLGWGGPQLEPSRPTLRVGRLLRRRTQRRGGEGSTGRCASPEGVSRESGVDPSKGQPVLRPGSLAHSAFQGPASLADTLLVLGPRLWAAGTLRWRLSLYRTFPPRVLLHVP